MAVDSIALAIGKLMAALRDDDIYSPDIVEIKKLRNSFSVKVKSTLEMSIDYSGEAHRRIPEEPDWLEILYEELKYQKEG